MVRQKMSKKRPYIEGQVPSTIPRYTGEIKIHRCKEEPCHFRDRNEQTYALIQGKKPHETKSLYRDLYEFYQNNEY